jgi:hypothetical protein
MQKEERKTLCLGIANAINEARERAMSPGLAYWQGCLGHKITTFFYRCKLTLYNEFGIRLAHIALIALVEGTTRLQGSVLAQKFTR